jgi:hypothetical protein
MGAVLPGGRSPEQHRLRCDRLDRVLAVAEDADGTLPVRGQYGSPLV